jgi:hypothetical protein
MSKDILSLSSSQIAIPFHWKEHGRMKSDRLPNPALQPLDGSGIEEYGICSDIDDEYDLSSDEEEKSAEMELEAARVLSGKRKKHQTTEEQEQAIGFYRLGAGREHLWNRLGAKTIVATIASEDDIAKGVDFWLGIIVNLNPDQEHLPPDESDEDEYDKQSGWVTIWWLTLKEEVKGAWSAYVRCRTELPAEEDIEPHIKQSRKKAKENGKRMKAKKKGKATTVTSSATTISTRQRGGDKRVQQSDNSEPMDMSDDPDREDEEDVQVVAVGPREEDEEEAAEEKKGYEMDDEDINGVGRKGKKVRSRCSTTPYISVVHRSKVRIAFEKLQANGLIPTKYHTMIKKAFHMPLDHNSNPPQLLPII